MERKIILQAVAQHQPSANMGRFIIEKVAKALQRNRLGAVMVVFYPEGEPEDFSASFHAPDELLPDLPDLLERAAARLREQIQVVEDEEKPHIITRLD